MPVTAYSVHFASGFIAMASLDVVISRIEEGNLLAQQDCLHRVHLVTCVHFRSRDKVGGHYSIRHSRKPHATRKLYGCV